MTAVAESALFDVVRDAVALVLSVPAGDLTLDSRLVDDLGADSLALIEIVEVSEERLRAQGRAVWVDDTTLARLDVLGDVVVALRDSVRRVS